MITNLPKNIVAFANGNEDVIDVYNKMKDYYFHYMSAVENKKLGDFDASHTLAEKEEKMHNALLSEISRLSGQPKPNELSFEAWSMNPVVKWATFATVGLMIDAIIPDTLIKDIGVFSDIETVGFGETVTFDVEPNSLFTISQSGNAQRKGFNKKQFATSETLSAVNHQITVEVALYKVLSGKESLAKFVRKAIISIEREMSNNAYDALNSLVDSAQFPKGLKETGYTVKALISLCQKVEAYNNGAKPVIMGTKQALYSILPESAKGYRMYTNAENPTINIVRGFFDWDIVELAQVATGTQYGLKLKDDRIYIMSPNADKIIKGVIEGQSLSNSDMPTDNADLTQHATLNKRWGFASVTNATMGVMTLE